RVAADVQLVQDRLRQGRGRRHVVAPVEVVGDQPAAAGEPAVVPSVRGVGGAPAGAAPQGRGGGGGHHRLGVEAGACPGGGPPRGAVAVQEVGGQVVDEDVPDVARPVDGRVERDLGDRLLPPLAEQDQVDALGVPGEDGEVDAAG